MRLARMGAFHQSRLSFMRVLLRRLKRGAWRFERPIWRIDEKGVGVATYAAIGSERRYTLICFSHDLPAEERSDRVIATAWDATFTLYDGEPSDEDIERLSRNVPIQEAGRVSESELVLSRANRSVRMFDYVVDCLAEGLQPDVARIEPVGYLMRTTAVYGSGKFGLADRDLWKNRPEFRGSFQPEMLTVWLIRSFTLDLVEHLARARTPEAAVTLAPDLRRTFGVGNSTGLGMAPFLISHPALIHRWIAAREEALSRVRSVETAERPRTLFFQQLLARAARNAENWISSHSLQQSKVTGLRADLQQVQEKIEDTGLDGPYPWDALYRWTEENLDLEGQEQVVSLLLEPYPELVDELSETMCADEDAQFQIDGSMTLAALRSLVERLYGWALEMDYSARSATARVWYVSEEKLEPRLGERFEEPLDAYEQPLAPGRDAAALAAALDNWDDRASIAEFLAACPEHRHLVRRIQIAARCPYAEIRDNTISAEMLPIDLLRCKLSFFGATRFDPRSDRWVRITMYQDAPFPEELETRDPDDLAYPPLGRLA